MASYALIVIETDPKLHVESLPPDPAAWGRVEFEHALRLRYAGLRSYTPLTPEEAAQALAVHQQ